MQNSNDVPAQAEQPTQVVISTTAPILAAEKENASLYLAKFTDLEIVDAETLKAARGYATEIRTKRLALGKVFAEAVTRMKGVVKAYGDGSAALVEQYNTREQEIRRKIEAYEEARRAERQKEEREAAAKFLARTNQLFEAGYAFNGAYYFVGLFQVTPDEIQGMSEEELAQTVAAGQKEKTRIDALLAAKPAEVVKEAPDEAAPETVVREPINPVTDWFTVEEGKPLQHHYQKPVSLAEIFTGMPAPPPPADERPVGFTTGFDACKNLVLELLAAERKYTRDQLREAVVGLRP